MKIIFLLCFLTCLGVIHKFYGGPSLPTEKKEPKEPSAKRPAFESPFSGLRLGVKGGLIHSEGNLVGSVNGAYYDRNKLSGWTAGVGPTLDFGYLARNHFYWGAEAEYATGMGTQVTVNSETDFNARDYRLQEKYAASGSLKMGYDVGDLLYFVKAGLARSKWDMTARYENGDYVKNTSSLWGGLVGVGFEHAISEKMALGFNVDYQFYNSFKFQNSARTHMWKQTPNTTDLMLTLKYKLA